ncbi:Phytochrome [Hondaea fermentalgiana]|uniref:histidine kinase n=1 Tax=Hondaea fermentalgiana TaxID=2315210 RepID=A0A2R5GDX3_9STRA|nr:Phytochrome [Hondaea fermentalgiana]|eukprot:GBG29136.1 Phytochrome [Hondaea fermentalgiana]
MTLPSWLRSIGLVSVDAQGRVVEWTPALAKMINAEARARGDFGPALTRGVPVQEVFGLSSQELKQLEDHADQPLVKKVWQDLKKPLMGLELVGSPFEMAQPTGDDAVGPATLLIEVKDISNRLLAEDRVENILETSFDGFWDWHIKADYEYMSPGFWAHFGYLPEEKEHKPSAWMDMINQEDLAVAISNMNKHFETKGKHPYLQEVRYRHKDGSTVWVRCKGRVVEWAPDGSAVRMVGTHTDVTKLKLRLAEIKEQKEAIERERVKVARLHEELRMLIEDANAPIFGVDRSGKINVWNKNMARILDVPVDKALGTLLADFAFNAEIKEVLREAIDEALSGTGKTNLWVKLASGETKSPVSLLVNTTQRISLEDGSVYGVFCLAQDVTELMEARENAIRERERAGAETALNEFMAHEVRNPLAAALSACSFAREDIVAAAVLPEDASVVNDLDVVRSSLSYIQELLTNVLDLNRHSTEAMTLCPRRTLVRDDVLEPIVTMLSYRNKELDISLECDRDMDVEVDSLRLKQVVMNVATNATKFTSDGFVRVRATSEPSKDDPSDVHLTIVVEDSGRGIPEDKRHKLFHRYCKLSSDMRGSGLGLCLSKTIIEQMGGTIELDPSYVSGYKPHRPGCRFVIKVCLRAGGRPGTPSLASASSAASSAAPREESEEVKSEDSSGKNISETPRQPAKRARQAEVPHPTTAPHSAADCPSAIPAAVRALVVDDDLVVRMTVRRQLERLAMGWSFAEAVNGEEALRKVGAVKNDPSMQYDIIVIDHFMPLTGGIMNGAETIAKLREVDPNVVIVGMSGNDQKSEHIRNGAQCFWPKPLPPGNRLRRDLAEAFAKSGYAIKVAEKAAAKAAASKRRKVAAASP